MRDRYVYLISLWLQHPDLNPLNYNIRIEIQQQVCPRKIHTMNGMASWYGWHGCEDRITNNATDEWCTSLSVCLCKRTTFLVVSLSEDSTSVHFNVLVL